MEISEKIPRDSSPFTRDAHPSVFRPRTISSHSLCVGAAGGGGRHEGGGVRGVSVRCSTGTCMVFMEGATRVTFGVTFRVTFVSERAFYIGIRVVQKWVYFLRF